jgi:glucokinase
MREGDPAAVISEYGLENQCSLCVAALDLLISIYGAAAGNVALTFMAVSGMYIGAALRPRSARSYKKAALCDRSFEGSDAIALGEYTGARCSKSADRTALRCSLRH